MTILNTLNENLAYAARRGHITFIGGGEFTPPELAQAAEAIRLAQLLARNAQDLLDALDRDLPPHLKHHGAGERLNLRSVLGAFKELA